MMDEWLGQHLAFMGHPADYRPTELRRRALLAIDAGGVGGVPMGDVHRALASAHLPARVVNLVVDRLVADGHVHRVRVETAGRPRVQMWSFRHAPEEVRPEMAYTGVWAPQDYSRLRWAGKDRESIVVEVLGSIRGIMLSVRGIEAAAGQIYIDAGRRLTRALYQGKRDGILKPGQVKAILQNMALRRLIMPNEFGDEFMGL